jgi:APA family basic amino acid/polyamine antiporter
VTISADAKRPLGFRTATSLVVGSMIGAGIFTTTGLLASDLGDERLILAAWLLGGLLALAGALSYGELGALMPEAGGDYAYLTEIYGPRVGFVAGFVTFVAGFAAPIGGVALALGSYVQALRPETSPPVTATLVVAGLTLVHASGVRAGARVNDLATALKLAVVVTFVVAGLLVPATAETAAPASSATGGSGPFAAALVLIAFAYTGWNAAAYIGGEIEDPERLLPRALVVGTAIVTVLYLALNVVYFRAAAPAQLAGVAHVGDVAARRLFGPEVASAFDVGIVLILFSTVSAFTMAGPRVTLAMARRGELPALLARTNARGAPAAAVAAQGVTALPFVWVSGLQHTLEYVGVMLTLAAALAVFGVIVLRRREPDRPRPYRALGYPLTPLAFVALSAWMIVFAARDSPTPVLWSAGTVVAGLLLRGTRRWSRAVATAR